MTKDTLTSETAHSKTENTKISKDSVVGIQYTLTNDKKEILDQSSSGEPLVYLHGSGTIIPGLEQTLEGKAVGDKLSVTIPPEKGYGQRRNEMVQVVPRNQFPEPEELKPGMTFHANTPQGTIMLTVVEVKDSEVVVDGNHPLAGENLHFDVTVESVREATEEELEHGHVHGPGGHHHE